MFISALAATSVGAQGAPSDLTQLGAIIARVTEPSGGGNTDLEVIRDGDKPPVGNSSVSNRHYDTYDGNNTSPEDWIGYAYGSDHVFTQMVFQEGRHFSNGGWYEDIIVQARQGATWVDVTGLVTTPVYPGVNDGVYFNTYTLDFDPIGGDAIRINGDPGGAADFISVAELEVFGFTGVCGDGVVGQPEECDDGGESATCDGDCTVAACGDDTVNAAAGESCDDGNTLANDGCGPTCLDEFCGDGLTNNIVEACDDGGESVTCDGDCTAAACGDSTINATAGEACDDGGESAACDGDCTAAACGDSTINATAGEACDDGGESATCDGDCRARVPLCNDGFVTPPEECDDGNLTDGDGCDSNCTPTACGNGLVSAGEECDDGNTVSSDGCSATCTIEGCGDGIVNGTEECDPPNTISCQADCTLRAPSDLTQLGAIIARVTEPGGGGNSDPEVIRDGDKPPVGSASPSSRHYDTYDGNNTSPEDWIGYAYGSDHVFIQMVFQEGRHFSNGGWYENVIVQARQGATWVDVTGLVIVPSYPGINDGVYFNTYALDFDPISGDAIRINGNPGGAADFISVAELEVFGFSSVCGDGVVGGPEECDDGNTLANDGCGPSCLDEFCGDGVTNNSVEACDDAGESATCDADCTTVACGDAVANTTAGESCDDGGESAACDADCTAATCGDATVNATAGESCDDGNSDDGDGCDSNCAAIWYVGDGWDDCVSGCIDDADCGSSVANACATLAYWSANRRGVLNDGDTVRMTGTLDSCGAVSCSNLCLVADTPGVTYEGRNPDDTDADSKAGVIIDASANTTGDSVGPCRGLVLSGVEKDFDSMTFRDMTLTGAQHSGDVYAGAFFQPPLSSGGCSGASTNCDGLTLDKVRVTGNHNVGGIQIGDSFNSEDNPCDGTWDTTNITIIDSEFDNNRGHGAVISCVDGGTVSGTSFHNNYNAGCDPVTSPGTGDCEVGGICDDGDGLILGAKNITFVDSSAYENGEDNWDIGNPAIGDCEAISSGLVFDRTISYDPICGSHYSFSHCANDVTVKNSVSWGSGGHWTQKSCAYDLKAYNNTFWGEGGHVVMMWDNCRGCDLRNNIIRTNDSNTNKIRPVFVSHLAANEETTWLNNLIFNSGSNTNMEMPTLDGGGAGRCPVSDPQSPGFVEGTNPAPETAIQIDGTGAATFAAECAAGDWFGNAIPGNCQSDIWLQDPGVVNGSIPSVPNLHLSGGGAAVNAGVCISPTLSDYDQDERPTCPTAWDIGFDQSSVCGDDVITGAEECDDGNTVSSDGCSATCTIEGCGDGIINGTEECEPPNTVNCDADCALRAPSDLTQLGTIIARVTAPSGGGNSDLEVIRDGDKPSVGSTSSSNRHYDTYDGANTSPEDWIGYVYGSDHVFMQVVFQEGKHFSDGGWYDDIIVQARQGATWIDATGLVITPSYPGTNDGVHFNIYTLDFDPIGGDAIRINGAPGGAADFISVAELEVFGFTSLCGDGAIGQPEECDDGNTLANDGCGPTCLDEFCGDGVTNNVVEVCDDGGESATCDADCTAAACGDATMNAAAGESCDDGGESPTCDGDCTTAVCGDATVNATAGESCDDGGESASCDGDCTAAACGDATANATAGESCDDGNTLGDDGCGPTCLDEFCGDGVTNNIVESCDDGNTVSSDGCSATCTIEGCGDGIVNGTEECEPPNTVSCQVDCRLRAPSDLTQLGAIIARVTEPSGGGNTDLEVIRDGDKPPVGNSSVSNRHYDTYDGNNTSPEDWIGYAYGSDHVFTQMVFQEGRHFSNGGWYEDIIVQARQGATWVDVTGLVTTPSYPGVNDGVYFNTYTLDFDSIGGDAIRINGDPGGAADFISVAELEVFGFASVCGDGVVNQSAEECDGVDDAVCPDMCQGDCTCIPWTCPPAWYGSGFPNDCDCGCGVVDPDCADTSIGSCSTCDTPGACSTICGDIDSNNNSTCNTCGDDVTNHSSEECDGVDDGQCSGDCQPNCRCLGVCGDGVLNEPTEECDGSDDSACPSGCQVDCTCGAFCGDEFINQPAEDCDGVDDNACPGRCSQSCLCVPDAWTCSLTSYGSGFSNDCDCGCDVTDPDCADASIGSCDYCNTPGACSTTCADIDPINNAICISP